MNQNLFLAILAMDVALGGLVLELMKDENWPARLAGPETRLPMSSGARQLQRSTRQRAVSLHRTHGRCGIQHSHELRAARDRRRKLRLLTK
jgi:hypothetical protein